MEIASDFDAARAAQERLLDEVASHGFSESALFAVKLAMEEGLTNAICHGNRGDAAKKVRLSFDVDDKRAVIVIADEGDGFNPAVLPDPTADENLDRPCGRGIMLMRAYMDEVEFNNRGNQIRLVKRNV